jgi:hypothetical protein
MAPAATARPYINAQPRFGIYRDWRAESQTIYFDKINVLECEPRGTPGLGRESAAGMTADAVPTRRASAEERRASQIVAHSSGSLVAPHV